MFYGPVLSRRFGYSLGIDIIPYKVCTYDCIYCQLGRTTNKTLCRKQYVNIDFEQFKQGLKEKIKTSGHIDIITFSGSGEPTLHADLGRLIRAAKRVTDTPVAVLTGGATLGQEDVLQEIIEADLVKVSLDAADGRVLERINRPASGVTFEKNIEGLQKLCRLHPKKIWLEIMVLAGINDRADYAYRFQSIIGSLGKAVEKVHLNTAIRSVRGGFLMPPRTKVETMKNILGSKAEVIGSAARSTYSGKQKKNEKDILSLLKRRPSTGWELAASTGFHVNEVIKICSKLMEEGKLGCSKNEIYFISKARN